MNIDYLVLILLLNVTIIFLGFVAPILGLATGMIWLGYGLTRLVQELADRKNGI